MNALILAAGFGTRMFPATLDRPKALLPVAGKPVIDYLCDAIRTVQCVQRIYVVTNDKFFPQFDEWRSHLPDASHFCLVNDGVTHAAARLGAIGDLRLGIEATGMGSALLVAAGDNIFCFAFEDFARFFNEKRSDCLTIHHEAAPSKLAKTGVVEVDAHWRVIGFEEKPKSPRSNYACPPIYIFRRATLPLIDEYLDGGNDPDAPGNFAAWLIHRRPVHAFLFQEPRYSIGDPASYLEACEAMGEKGRW